MRSGEKSMNDPVVIVGAGFSGLTAAKTLHEQGVPFVLLEASDAVGGRARTDLVDGFLLEIAVFARPTGCHVDVGWPKR